MTLGNLLSDAGIHQLLAGSHDGDLRPVDVALIDELVDAHDGWQVYFRQVCADGSMGPIILGTPDDGTLEIIKAECRNLAGTRQVLLTCRLDDLDIKLTVAEVRATVVLEDEPAMVHPMMHRRAGIVSRFRQILKGA